MPAAAPAKPRRREEPAGPILQVSGLHVRFGSQVVLRDITLDLEVGRTLVILGESGCGKTVLLKSMIGLIRPSAGDVRFEGTSLASLNARALAHLRTRYGFVFQGAALFDSLSILDNVAFPLREHTRLAEGEIRHLVESLIDEVGLPRAVLSRKPVQLSGGMRKRAGLARALALDPQLMLYDEPTTGLDPIMTDVINELILRVGGQHDVTSVVVTHDMNTARKVADRVVMLYPAFRLAPGEPQIVFDGTAEDLDRSRDPRVRQFVEGRAGSRLMELREEQGTTAPAPRRAAAADDGSRPEDEA
ncbi:MAG: ABC transporter ATP-binding protein [Planctomycetes bacterium]|nr:ABC transporter ATP-binding protein [Planctomycetota bacterium]